MSDMMLKAVIRMPYEMAMESELSRRQFYARANQALDEMEAYAAAKVQEALEEASGLCDRFANRMMSAEECADAIRALIHKPISE